MFRLPRGRRNPTRERLGTASLRYLLSLLVFSSAVKVDSPVTLPPGCARLVTKTCTHRVRSVRHHDGDGSCGFLGRYPR